MTPSRHHVLLGTLNGALALILLHLALNTSDTSAVAAWAPPADLPWTSPSWFPEEQAEELWVLEHLDGDGTLEGSPPRVRARAAIVADLDRGEVLYAYNADAPYPVASLTKMVSGLALASAQPDLTEELCVSYEQWPSRPGAKSRFDTGSCHEGWEYLGAALVASDNRGAMAFPALAGLSYDAFIDRMDEVSSELGMGAATWADPSGLEDDNMATARDMLKAVVAVAAHPDLAAAASAPFWEIDRPKGKRRLGTTNRLRDRWETLAAKTGYTDTARYCYATAGRTSSGRRLGVVVLGANTKQSRFDIAWQLIHWAERDRPHGS
ncbi:MAG: D-alanyl-D-alanine carboxypeptidase [Deltaproteobacteria bacterium]|nr:D-alanyl-D-alanine carboxypeptidase [Deltaproteobacteria bacterium]